MSWRDRAQPASLSGGSWRERAESLDLGDEPGKIESAARGLAQGASMGFADEITGGLESLFTDKPYEQARDESRANYARAKDANPSTYTTGEIGGGVASALLPGANIARGASLGKAVLQSALLGGVTGLGYSEADDLGGLAKDTAANAALGGLVGGAAQKFMPMASRALEKVGESAGDMAEKVAARALGAERGTIKSLGMDRVKGAGRYALDNELLGLGASTEDMVAKNAAIKSRGGEMMGKAYQAIDDAGASTFNPREVAEKVDDQLGDIWRSPLNRGEVNQFDNTIEAILARGPGDIPISEAQLLKEELGSAANWKNKLQVSPKEQMARDAYRIVSEQIDEAVKLGQGAVDQAGLSTLLDEGKALYSKGSTAEQLLENKLAREEGNKFIGLTDAITGAGSLGYGGATGDWETAAGIMGAKKLGEKYGAKAAARGLDQVSKALMKSPQMADLANRSPQVFNAIAQKMENVVASPVKAAENEPKPYDKTAIMNKVRGTKFEQTLQSAAQRGDQAFNAAYFVLQNNPEYRASVQADDHL